MLPGVIILRNGKKKRREVGRKAKGVVAMNNINYAMPGAIHFPTPFCSLLQVFKIT